MIINDYVLLGKKRWMMEFSSEISAIDASWASTTLCSKGLLGMVSGVCWGEVSMGGMCGVVVVVGLVIVGETIARLGDKVITTLPKEVFEGKDGACVLKVVSTSSSMCDQDGLG